MQHLKRLLELTGKVRETTVSIHGMDAVERYVTSFNSWLLDRPLDPLGAVWANAIFECSVLSEASYFLAVHGFYEEACGILRILLDSFLTRLYWDTLNRNGQLQEWAVNDRSTNDYSEWEMGTIDKYPKLKRDVWPTLLTNPRIANYNKQYRIKADAESTLNNLNRFIHNRPISRHYGGATRSSSLNIRFTHKVFRGMV